MSSRLRIAIFGGMLALAGCPCGQEGALAQTEPHASVYAGTGRAGLADGQRAQAEFVLPTAITTDGSGNLYVADSAAQRIRVIARNGRVSTVAGSGSLTSSRMWVQPGYRDGPALQAQFNRPAGLAIGPDGKIFIADSDNHCVRLLQGGTVSTYAGKCGTMGTKDGPRSEALFSFPRQMVYAPDGALYIADFQNAVRRIDASGIVTTLSIDVDKRVTGVAIDGDRLAVADATGISWFDLAEGKVAKVPEYFTSRGFPPPVSGGMELGSPYALAAGDSAQGVFYTDLAADAVRRYNDHWLDYLTGVPREDAPLGTAFTTSTLPLHGPMGIALGGHGELFVADSGHKRIVQISGFPLTRGTGGFLAPPSLLSLPPSAHEYRILIMGDSFVWFTSQGSESIGARLERKLKGDPTFTRAGRVPRVLSLVVGEGIAGQTSLAREVVAQASVDFVVIIVTGYDMWHYTGPDWKEQFRKQEADTVSELSRASKPSMFVYIPSALESTPYEQLYEVQNLAATNSDYESVPKLVVEQIMGIGPPVLDLTPFVQKYEAGENSRSLYNNYDLHPTANGREFIADHIFATLRKLRAP